MRFKTETTFLPLILKALVLSAHQVATDPSLEQGHDLGEAFVTHVFKVTQHASLEEDFGVADSVLVGVNLEGVEDFLCYLLAVGESLGHDIGGENGVSVIVGTAGTVMRGENYAIVETVKREMFYDITTYQ